MLVCSVDLATLTVTATVRLPDGDVRRVAQNHGLAYSVPALPFASIGLTHVRQ